MEQKTLSELTASGKDLFSKIAKAYKANGIDLVMTDLVPQRGGILSEAVKEGATAYMAGGQDGQKFFDNIPQYTLPYDTFTVRTDDTVGEIVSCLPKDLCSDRVGLFLYIPMGDRLWSRAFEKHTGSKVIATNEQNLRSYFEEKTNLDPILRAAGLSKHVIPSQIIRETRPLEEVESTALYDMYASKEGKIVVQFCGEGCSEKGGGYSTMVIDNYEDFAKVCSEQRDSYMKVAKFISGCNSNLSLCCGNLVPGTDMMGAVKNNLTESESRYSGSTIFSMMHRARGMGISENNVIVNVQPGTLKVVGAPQLTSISTNGVGNQLNYNYPQETLDTIYNIGNKLGTLMAMCGKVGLCGADLIITKEGEVYVNEINDRQQGPTESASLNNEAHGLPGLHRTAFMLNFGDLKNQETYDYLKEVGARSREIYDESLQIPSPFYIKFISKYPGYAKQDVRAGEYALTQDLYGKWNWKLDKNLSKGDGSLPVVDLSHSDTTVVINSVSMNQGDYFPKENQLLRINGVSMPGSMPFGINSEGKSVLSKEWEAPIEDLYDQVLQRAETNTKTYGRVEEEGKAEVVEFTPVEGVVATPKVPVVVEEESENATIDVIKDMLGGSSHIAADSAQEDSQ